ncbi:prepilin-type N-terminal cleavage/methylation domain-containing protein [Vibrio vulnificus]|nr:prepilin-type N-terminal cleavage/methylation domain-containing protein [Vibrio vulnificus]
MKGNRKQLGMTLIEALISSIIFSIIALGFAQIMANINQTKLIDIAGARLGNVANALVKYQAYGGDPAATPPILAPADQWNQSGQPFEHGAVHVGLDWLKPTICGGSAPIELLPCETREQPAIGDLSVYRVVIENDGVNINAILTIVDQNDATRGVVIQGQTDDNIASQVATVAEGVVKFTAQGATNSTFTVTGDAIVTANIGLNIANSPYLRRDGRVSATGTQKYENGAGIEGASIVSSNRFAAHDTASNTPSTSRYLAPAGQSFLEDVDLQNLSALKGEIDELSVINMQVDGAVIENAAISNVSVGYLQQTDPNVRNSIAGELAIGSGGNYVAMQNGHIEMTGILVSANNTDYFVNPAGISLMDDIAIGSRGNLLLSDLLPNYVERGVQLVTPNSIIPKPACGANGAARIKLLPQTWSSLFLDNGQIRINENLNLLYADDNGANWTVHHKTYRVSDQALIDDPNGTALAEISCYYP